MADELQSSAQEQPTPSPPSPASLLSDPALLGKLVSVMGALQNAPGQPSADSPASPAADGLAKVLSDPALMEKLPQIMATLAPMLAASTPPKAEAVPTAVLPHSPTADRDNLLLAIKPFLSSGRRDAVDTILRLEKLGEFFRSQHK